MNSRMLIGLVLIALGAIALIYQGITYTRDEKVVDIGPVEVSAEKQETIPLPPILGVLSIVAGIGIAATGRKR